MTTAADRLNKPSARTPIVCETVTVNPSPTAWRALPCEPTRYAAMTVLPCPGETACSAPRPAAASSDRMITVGVRSAAWKRDVTSLPSSVVPAGTDTGDETTGGAATGSTTFESTGVASGTTNGTRAAPPAVA